MDYRQYYKQVSSMADDLMEGKAVKAEGKPSKGFVPKPRDTSEDAEEQDPVKIVAEYIAFFRQDAIKGLEEVGIDADFIKGNIAKRSKEE